MPLDRIEPGDKADAEIHLGQEWVDCIFATRANFSEKFLQRLCLADLDDPCCDVEEFKLGYQFLLLHLLI